MKNPDIRILICDDHGLFRIGLISLLKDEQNLFIIGEAEDGEELVRKYFQLMPDIVIADISMPKKNGIEAIKEIKRSDKGVKALFLTMLQDEQYIYHSVKMGAMGLINKNVIKGELIFAINSIYNGKRYFGPAYTEEIIKEIIQKYEQKKENLRRTFIDRLTEREEQIVEFISEGLMSNQIAEKIGISKRTVDSYRIQIMQKFNIKTLPALIKFAVEYSIFKKNSNDTVDF